MQFLDKAGLKLIKKYIDQSVTSVPVNYGTTEYWNSKIGYVPAKGEIIVYTDRATVDSEGHPVSTTGIKIGSGNGYVQDLGFMDDQLLALLDHVNDSSVHVTNEQKMRWDDKLNIDGVSSENLIFNRN